MFKRASSLLALSLSALVAGSALAQTTFPTPQLPSRGTTSGSGSGSFSGKVTQGDGGTAGTVLPWIVQHQGPLPAGTNTLGKVLFDAVNGPLPSQVWIGGTLVSSTNPMPVANIVNGALVGASNPLPVDTVVRALSANRSLIIPVAAASAAVSAGGSGYAVNDTITNAAGTFRVAAVASGAVTAVAVTSATNLTAIPAPPLGQTATSGSGTGATLTPAYVSASVQLAPANATRRGISYQPQGYAMRVNGLGAATQDQNSLYVPSNAFYETPAHHIGTGAVSAIGDIGVTVPVPVYAREF